MECPSTGAARSGMCLSPGIGDAPPYAEDVMGKRINGVELALRSGESVKVPIGEDQFGADKRVAELSAALRAALEAYRRIEAVDDAAFLARGDRSKEASIARLRGLGEGANAGPREAPDPCQSAVAESSRIRARAPLHARAPRWRSRVGSTRQARSASGSRPRPPRRLTCESPWKRRRRGTKRPCPRPWTRLEGAE